MYNFQDEKLDDDANRCTLHGDKHNGSEESSGRVQHSPAATEVEETAGCESSDSEESSKGGQHLEGAKRRRSEDANVQAKQSLKKEQVISLVQNAIELTLARDSNTVTSYFSKNGNYSILCNRNYSETVSTLLTAFKIRSLSMTWRELRNLTPANYYTLSDFLTVDQSIDWFLRILRFNSISPREFIERTFEVVDKKLPKINTLVYYGEPNSGKTLIANSIARSCLFYSAPQDFQGRSTFEFAPLINSRIVLINEPKISDVTIETFKNVMEGQSVAVDKKYAREYTEVHRCPLLITSNKNLWELTSHKESDRKAIEARCFKFTFLAFADLASCRGQLNPLMWSELCNSYDC